MQPSILRLPVSHTAMRQLLLVRPGCHGFPGDLGRGSGICYVGAALVTSCILCSSVKLCKA